jgi:hypothetical protein
MADVILVSQLRDCLVHATNITMTNIQSILPPTLIITGSGQRKPMNNQLIWFHRFILNSKIILSDGIHPSRDQAEKLAFEKMITLMTHEQGVEPKTIANGRCKVIVRKYLVQKQLNETSQLESTINSSLHGY